MQLAAGYTGVGCVDLGIGPVLDDARVEAEIRGIDPCQVFTDDAIYYEFVYDRTEPKDFVNGELSALSQADPQILIARDVMRQSRFAQEVCQLNGDQLSAYLAGVQEANADPDLQMEKVQLSNAYRYGHTIATVTRMTALLGNQAIDFLPAHVQAELDSNIERYRPLSRRKFV
jgi:hypothetical protein